MPNPVDPALAGAAAAGAVAGARDTIERVVPDPTGLVDGITAVRAWVSDRHNWVRVAWFSGGVVLFVVGASMLARPVTAPITGKVAGAVLRK